jgi:glycosyltransferase involved in cell wall biosynthesis
MAKVSVILPTYNRPERLSNALRSVLTQTEQDFEVFVIDDGSPSEAAAVDVVRAYGDPRLQCIRLAGNRGAAAARNAGLIRAHASFIAFLDDDDDWLPAKLEVQLAFLQQRGPRVGGVHTAWITVDETAGTRVTTRCIDRRFDPTRGINDITTSAVLMRRECFDAVGLFDEELPASHDFDMWIRVSEAFDLLYLDHPLVRYYLHPGHRITDDDARKVVAAERMLVKHRRLFEANRHRHCLEYVSLGARYTRLGDAAAARKALRRAGQLWPFEPRVYWGWLRLLRASTSAGRTGAQTAPERRP